MKPRQKRTNRDINKSKIHSVKIPLVLPFHQSSIKITGIIHKNAKILADDDEYGHLFDKNIVTAYKNDKNLKTLLVHSLFLSKELQGTFPCNRSKCYTCPFVAKNDILIGPSGTISLKGSFNCISTHVIYAIVCTDVLVCILVRWEEGWATVSVNIYATLEGTPLRVMSQLTSILSITILMIFLWG